MTADKGQIPVLSTRDLWNRYVHSDHPLESVFREKPEEFLISRLEDNLERIILPTLPHRREVHEWVFVTSGKVVRGANLNAIEIQADEIHLTLASQISTLDYLSPDLTGFYCHFNLETIIQLYHKEHMIHELVALGQYMQTRPVHLPAAKSRAVRTIFERLTEEYQTHNEPKLIDAYLVTLCYEVKSALPRKAEAPKQSRAHELTDTFKQLIITHAHEHQPISFYARHLGVTPNHLNKAVMQCTGRQASSLVAEMLILEAKVLLRHAAFSVSEVAYKLGFLDPSYFSRFFKSHTGETPGGYKSRQ